MKPALLLFVLLAVVAVTAANGAPTPITATKISPWPFYADEPLMVVSFRTAQPAPVGRLYFAQWATLSTTATKEDCSVSSRVDPLGARGGTGVLVKMKLTPEPIFGDSFCAGPSFVQIYTQRAGANRRPAENATRATGRIVGKYYFRVTRP